MTTTSSQPPFGLRMPPELKGWIKSQATENHRSMNAEIVSILQKERKGQEATASN